MRSLARPLGSFTSGAHRQPELPYKSETSLTMHSNPREPARLDAPMSVGESYAKTNEEICRASSILFSSLLFTLRFRYYGNSRPDMQHLGDEVMLLLPSEGGLDRPGPEEKA